MAENNQTTQPEDFGKIFFQWKFMEFQDYQRTAGWYVVMGLVLVALIIYSFFTNNFLFVLFLILAGMTVILLRRNNKEIEFIISEGGITVADRFYEYTRIKNFFIVYQPPRVKTLYFEPKALLEPRIPIELGDRNPVEIRKLLRQYLEEDLERENEPTSDQFKRLLKL